MFQESYSAIMRYSRAADGFWVRLLSFYVPHQPDSAQYRSVNIHSGDAAYFTVDSLSAFWPGLQVLAGDVQNAIQSHQMCPYRVIFLCHLVSLLNSIPCFQIGISGDGIQDCQRCGI